MKSLRTQRTWTIVLATLALVTAAGMAAADAKVVEHDERNSVFNFGYDRDNRVFLANYSADDSPFDCTLQNGPLLAGYGEALDGEVPVDTLESSPGESVEFSNRPAVEVGPDFTPAEGPVLYTGADGECGLIGHRIGGPNGQINHGQFMRLFNQLVDIPGRGCVNRFLARSHLGKGDDQVRTSDADEEFESGTSGSIDFATALADCTRGDRSRGNEKPGKPDKAGRPDNPGNSGNARGRNK